MTKMEQWRDKARRFRLGGAHEQYQDSIDFIVPRREVWNAALKALGQLGTVETGDEDAGVIRGHIRVGETSTHHVQIEVTLVSDGERVIASMRAQAFERGTAVYAAQQATDRFRMVFIGHAERSG